MELREFFDSRWPANCFMLPVGSEGSLPGGLGGIYCMVIETPTELQIVYVGKAVNIRARLHGHEGNGWNFQSKAFVDWIEEAEKSGGAAYLWTRAIASPSERAKLEIEAIHALRPCWNVHDVAWPGEYPSTCVTHEPRTPDGNCEGCGSPLPPNGHRFCSRPCYYDREQR